MLRQVREFASSGVHIKWLVEGPRFRSYLVRGSIERKHFPTMAYALTTSDSDSRVDLYPFCLLDRTDDFTADTALSRMYVPNMTLFGVCFGTASALVHAGRLDPIEAFWMTSFQRPIGGLVKGVMPVWEHERICVLVHDALIPRPPDSLRRVVPVPPEDDRDSR